MCLCACMGGVRSQRNMNLARSTRSRMTAMRMEDTCGSIMSALCSQCLRRSSSVPPAAFSRAGSSVAKSAWPPTACDHRSPDTSGQLIKSLFRILRAASEWLIRMVNPNG